MAQHKRNSTSGPGSEVYHHLKQKDNSFDDNDVHILDREDNWFERGVRKVFQIENPSLNRDEV